MASKLNISNVEEYLVQIVQEVNPDVDLREGTAFRDLLIKPLTSFLDPIIDEIVRIGNSQTLLNASTITERDMDELVANVFVTRRGGTQATGSVRLFLSSAENGVEVPKGSIFSDSQGLQYSSTQRVFLTRQALELNVDGSFFFVDVPIQAENPGTEFNLAVGQVTIMDVPPVNFVRVTNTAAITTGVDKETNTALGDRAQVAITVRDLVSEPGIITQLLENFPSIVEIRPIGFGDVEMIRDVVTTDGTILTIGGIDFTPASGTSIGGLVDAYIKPSAQTTEEIQVGSMTEFVSLRPREVSVPPAPSDDPAPSATLQYLDDFKRPAVDIVEIEELDSVTLEPTGTFLVRDVDFEVLIENDTTSFSTREKRQVHLIGPDVVANTGLPFAIRYLHASVIIDAQAYIENTDNRTVSAGLLAKHAIPTFTDISLTVTQPTSFTQTAADYQNGIINFINSVTLGGALQASDIIDAIYDVAGSSSDIQVTLPFTIDVDEHFVDGTVTPSSSSNEIIIDRTKVFIPRSVAVALVIA